MTIKFSRSNLYASAILQRETELCICSLICIHSKQLHTETESMKSRSVRQKIRVTVNGCKHTCTPGFGAASAGRRTFNRGRMQRRRQRSTTPRDTSSCCHVVVVLLVVVKQRLTTKRFLALATLHLLICCKYITGI